MYEYFFIISEMHYFIVVGYAVLAFGVFLSIVWCFIKLFQISNIDIEESLFIFLFGIFYIVICIVMFPLIVYQFIPHSSELDMYNRLMSDCDDIFYKVNIYYNFLNHIDCSDPLTDPFRLSQAFFNQSLEGCESLVTRQKEIIVEIHNGKYLSINYNLVNKCKVNGKYLEAYYTLLEEKALIHGYSLQVDPDGKSFGKFVPIKR